MDNTHSSSPDQECRLVLLSSLLAIAIIAGLTFMVALAASYFVPSALIGKNFGFTEISAMLVCPEPIERTVFQIMLLVSPVIVLLSNSIVIRLNKYLDSRVFSGNAGYFAISALAVAWINSWAFYPNFMMSSELGSFSLVLPAVSIMVLLAYAFGRSLPFKRIDSFFKKRFWIVFSMISAFCLSVAISYRIFDWRSLAMSSDYPLYHYENPVFHINPVLYYISLAEKGFYSTPFGAPTYGFYSMYLKPIFSMLGLTTYSFSSVMTLLYLLGLITIAVPVFRHMGNIYLKLLLIPTLCALQISLSQAFFRWDPYFQYYPIRFLVPALSVFMLFLIIGARKENVRYSLSIIFSFILGFLVFWNFDSGITVAIAWAGFFLLLAVAEVLRTRKIKNKASSMCFSVLSMLAIGAGTAVFMLIEFDRSGISFEHMFEMQRIFYLAGYGMLPIPKHLHPWMAVVGVYITVLALTLPAIFRNGLNSSPRRLLAFFIAIIGFGLFAYYQGRSHDMNLPAVVWPAILCCFLACDWCLSSDFQKPQPAIRFLCIPFVILCAALALKLALNAPWYVKRLAFVVNSGKIAESDPMAIPVSYELERLSRYQAEPPGSVLIIHQAESIFYVECGLYPSPLLAADQERLLRRQEADMQNLIKSGRVRHIFISPILPQTPEYGRLGETVRSLYRLEDYTPLLQHWTLKEQLPR